MRLFERTIHRLNENGSLSNEIPPYAEVLSRFEHLRLYGDDSTAQVEDTPGGQMVRLLNPVGGEGGFTESSLRNTDFVVRIDDPDSFIIGEGGLVIGDDIALVPESIPLTSGSSLFINLVVYYNTDLELYGVLHQGSIGFPPQNNHGNYSAERFPLAYVTFDGGGDITQIDQLNSHEIRTHRLN